MRYSFNQNATKFFKIFINIIWPFQKNIFKTKTLYSLSYCNTDTYR